MRRLVAAMMLSGLAVPAMAAEAPPPFTYRHLWTDAKGESHIAVCRMAHFDLKSMSPPADPQWQDRDSGAGHALMTIQPDRWNGAWHEDPHPQWIVPLRGRWFVEAQDGTRAEMGPGDIMLGEDQNTRPNRAGEKGHLAGNLTPGPVDLMVVQLDAAPTIDRPCHFR